MTRYLYSAPQPAVRVRCLRCRHESRLTETGLRQFGIPPAAAIASYVKRLRCKKCGSQSVEASHVETPQPVQISETYLVRRSTKDAAMLQEPGENGVK